MKNSLPVAIVVPFRNRAALLPRTLSSLRAQTYRPLQLYLVDDGSTDKSCEVCRRFQQESDSAELRVTLLQTGGTGVCHARNAGLAACDTPWVYFFDSDDEATPTYIEDVMTLLARDAEEKGQTPDIVACATVMHFPGGKTKARDALYTASVTDQILCGHMATHGMFFKTETLRKAGGWNEKLAKWNDWELGVRLLWQGCTVQWMGKRTYHCIHQHPDSITGTGFSPSYPALIEAIKEVNKLLAHEEGHAMPAEAAPASQPPKKLSAWAHNEDNRASALLALAARAAVLHGKLWRESSPDAAKAALRLSEEISVRITPRWASAAAVWTVANYAKRVGKGAWRVALALVRLSAGGMKCRPH